MALRGLLSFTRALPTVAYTSSLKIYNGNELLPAETGKEIWQGRSVFRGGLRVWSWMLLDDMVFANADKQRINVRDNSCRLRVGSRSLLSR